MTPTLLRAGALLLTIMVSACASAQDSSAPPPSPASPAQPGARPSCEVALPASWRQALADGAVDAGSFVSTTPLTVGPTGEVAAVRDNGDTRDLLLIGPDKSVTAVYPVPDPRSNDVGFVAMDDRWIVVGVEHAPRRPNGGRPYRDENGNITATNGPQPRVVRIDVIDRKDNSVRTVVDNPETSAKKLDSIALSADTLRWITRTTYTGDEAIPRSYDLKSGAVVEGASGVIRDVRATAVGTNWFTIERFPTHLVRNLASVPAAVASVDDDRPTLATDGTNYAWITGIAQGGNGFAHWSPDTGLTRIKSVSGIHGQPVYVDGPYVLLDRAVHGSGRATIVDTRSGAIALLDDELVDAGGGTIALRATAPVDPVGDRPDITMLIRTDALPPLSC